MIPLTLGIFAVLIGGLALATGLHIYMKRRYVQRDYRPDLQQTARLITITRWTTLAVVVVIVYTLIMEERAEAAFYIFGGWIVVTLILKITSATLRKWGTEA